MRKLIGGSEEQFKNLVKLLESSGEDLPKIQEDAYVDHYWSLPDVQEQYDCNDETARDILYSSLTNECTMDQVWYSISHFAEEDYDLKRIDEEVSHA